MPHLQRLSILQKSVRGRGLHGKTHIGGKIRPRIGQHRRIGRMDEQSGSRRLPQAVIRADVIPMPMGIHYSLQ